MKNLVIIASVLLVCSRQYNVIAVLPGPRVYVVTPSPRPLQIDEGRSVPFYYHNWMRRMDGDNSAQNTTTTTTTTTEVPKLKTPDLIFAEFETGGNDNMKKTIRKLLEKEKVVPKTTTTTTTTSRPIYVPDEDYNKVTRIVNYGIPVNMKQDEEVENKPSGSLDYFSMYNKLYENMPPPVYFPSTQSTTTTTTMTSTTPESSKVENIWHIIDSEKINQYSGNWEEVPVDSSEGNTKLDEKPSGDEDGNKITKLNSEEEEIDDNFAFPGLGSNSGIGAENESRAIRTEPNLRFPYVNLKPFMLKTNKKSMTNYEKKKGNNNLMTNLDNFHDLKNPVRGEAQDTVPMRDIVDRYNPAQPYLPQPDYGSKNSKQNSISTPPKATANLVPPPPPPVPKVTANDFPTLTSYESFPPYPQPSFDSMPPAPPAPKAPGPLYSAPTVDTSDDSDFSTADDFSSDGSPMNTGYQYKQPAPRPMPPMQQFIPTIPPVSKPSNGYSYDKPPMTVESPMMATMDNKPDFHGYHYNKPEPASPPSDTMPPSYGHHDAPPAYGHDSDYPELIFQKHHDDSPKGSDDMNGMVPPPPDAKPADHSPPMDDHGFPSDFPGDFKYHHDFDDHYYHHHHHHPTTTTTEMPRVNRYSYYYLGKKLYYLPLYFSVYFIVYVGALIIKAVLRHKIVYPNSWRPNGTTASFFSKRSVDSYLSNDNLHEVTGRVTHALATAAEKYLSQKSKNQ